MNVYLEKSGLPKEIENFFPIEQLDAFHNPDLSNCIYGDDWYSVLITDDTDAFFHVFSKNLIPNSDFYDVEPFIGYSGPVVTTSSPGFLNLAIEEYSQICRDEVIIAEVIRFNPLLENHSYFGPGTKINIQPAKDIVIVDCFNDDNSQLNSFSKTGRYETRKAISSASYIMKDKSESLSEFVKFYYKSLERVGADTRWYFGTDFFDRVKTSNHFEVRSVTFEDKIVSAALVIFYPFASYYFIAANDPLMPLGANNYLIFNIAKETALRGSKKLILGGGVSSNPKDKLLAFKRKFAKKSKIFYIGKLIHNEKIYQELCTFAITQDPNLKDVNYFLKYRIIKKLKNG